MRILRIVAPNKGARFEGLRRKVISPRNSALGSGRWEWMDWNNWWMDSWSTDSGRYLHVEDLDKEDGAVYRVCVREIQGRSVGQVVEDGEPIWLYSSRPA